MSLDDWLRSLAATGRPADELLGGLAVHLGAPWDGPADLPVRLRPPEGHGGPDLLGWALEALTEPAARKRHGVHHTPARVAERLVAIALDGLEGPVAVCDPAVGGGAFLLAVGRALAARGEAPADIVEHQLFGRDLDPLAVAVTRSALAAWAAGPPPPAGHLDVGDGLEPGWGQVDVVVGNPPFQSQLFRRTARAPRPAGRRPEGSGAYTDTATLFLLAAVRAVRPGGRVVMIQPQSVLASRDAEPARRLLSETAVLEGLWVADEPVFAASTRVCAPVLRVGAPGVSQVARWKGPGVEPAPPAAPGPWASLAAGLGDVPDVSLRGRPFPDLQTATAGFRDEYYGLIPFVSEADGPDDPRPRLVTSGLVDPAHCRWGERRATFARRRLVAPVIDVDALRAADARLARWVDDRLTPKVLVATQTRVIEAVADPDGRLVPSTPVVSVGVDPERVWFTLAALLAPPVTAWALHRASGAALGAGALKLSARQIRGVPEPVVPSGWQEGAELARHAQTAPTPEARYETLLELGVVMTAAYGVEDGDQLMSWWTERLARPDSTQRGQ